MSEASPRVIEQETSNQAGVAYQRLQGAEASPRPEDEDRNVEAASTSSTPCGNSKATQGWMVKSSLLNFFDVKFKDGKKTANCKHCGKCYKEGESTGNLSKHVRALHPAAFRAQNGKISKTTVLDALLKKRKSLQISQSISSEFRKNPHTFRTALIVAEGFLPLNFVELTMWSTFGDENCPAPIRSRATFAKKLQSYSAMLDETLSLNFHNTHLVNIQLDIWTARSGESYMGLLVSFAPNVWNRKLLDDMEDHRILLSDDRTAQNTHLLDFVSLGQKKHTGKSILSIFSDLLKKHNLTDKVATITMDNASNNVLMYQSFIFSRFNDKQPLAGRLLGKTRYIRCASHVLNIHFKAIVSELFRNPDFAEALRRIKVLAKTMRRSPRICASLKEAGIPLIPLEAPTRWMYTWRQLKLFLENYVSYKLWFEGHEDGGDTDIIYMLRGYIYFDERTLSMLDYFVKSLQVFNDFSMKFQNDSYNHLSNGIPFYYLIDSFYSYCKGALQGHELPKKRAGSDFSCLNGTSELLRSDKRLVLEAILASKKSHQKYLTWVRQEPLYYVAVILDPGAKAGALYRMMSNEEADERMKEALQFIQSYLKEYDSCVDLRASKLVEKQATHGSGDLIFDREDFRETSENSQALNDADTLIPDDEELMEEYYTYLREPLLKNRSTETAVAWWYQQRSRFPRLLPLAISLFYTKLSSCEVERTFSLASRVMRKDRTRLSARNFKSLMLLRDRFDRFGFYKRGPSALRDVCNEKYDIYEANDEELDPFELHPASDDTLCGSDRELDDDDLEQEAAEEDEEIMRLVEQDGV
ncbi:putative transposase of the Rover4 hAT-like family [Lachancea mirantina]|uniref:Putative transposase of the Rover4 hAT-like family n=1 Tax=Lachancea mirantina TaxID=1230905 RepID=A0A078BFZ0_9SACH|nr:putative transposase of the Rover4 hAT-like family [Lachancea mirantina]SCV03201.1 putative transposase of the Rover4 hAT-like family [Lachancea mirantina]